jgi:hypothetical protein
MTLRLVSLTELYFTTGKGTSGDDVRGVSRAERYQQAKILVASVAQASRHRAGT